jgi:hypothetical protein
VNFTAELWVPRAIAAAARVVVVGLAGGDGRHPPVSAMNTPNSPPLMRMTRTPYRAMKRYRGVAIGSGVAPAGREVAKSPSTPLAAAGQPQRSGTPQK